VKESFIKLNFIYFNKCFGAKTGLIKIYFIETDKAIIYTKSPSTERYLSPVS